MHNRDLKDSSNRAIAKEVLQDMFTMYICFNIQSKIKNPFIQEIYGYIMVFFYSVFLHELYTAKLLDENQATKKPKKMINEFRQRFLKKKAILGKTHLEEIRKEMGIDFEHLVYDIILTVDKNDEGKLYSINLGLWDLEQNEREKLEMFNALAGLPEKLIKELLSSVNEKQVADNALEIIDAACEAYAKEMDKQVSPIKYPYASAIFFKSPEPQKQDKYLILYYYSYFSLFNLLDKFVPALKVEGEVLGLNIPYSLMKLKAMLVEAFGGIISELDTPILQKIKREMKNCFGESDIYRLNRRLRNNIHYTAIDKISDSELEKIDGFQRKYIQIVLSAFGEAIKFKFGKGYRFIKWVADHTDSKILEERNSRKM